MSEKFTVPEEVTSSKHVLLCSQLILTEVQTA